MGTVVDVTQDTFATAVLQRSFEQPVLVDFYAQWCGPCQLLKPMLEGLTQEYNFVLAKVDIDQQPELAQAFQVEGVPDVRIATQGTLQAGFVGMLPEAQVRELLQRLGLASGLEQGLAQLAKIQADQGWAAAQPHLDRLLAEFPHHLDLQLQAVQIYLQQQLWEAAEAILAPLDPKERGSRDRVAGLRGLLALRAIGEEDPAAEDVVATGYRQACQAAITGDYDRALEGFLTVVRRDRTYRQDGARKAMLTLFQVLGDDHRLTTGYRKQLMQALY